MLALPDVGVRPSVTEHNCRTDIIADWVEASVLFGGSAVSDTDIEEMLLQGNVYRTQDFVSEFVRNVWLDLRRRSDLMGAQSPYQMSTKRIVPSVSWREVPVFSFLSVLSLQHWYEKWARKNGFDKEYALQGELFEEVTEDSLKALGWMTRRTGWSPGNAKKIRAVIAAIVDCLGEPEIPQALERWISDNANDDGLDVVCYDPFPDARGGRPVFFFQCASGADWTTKSHTPDPDTWARLISFTTIPQRGFAIPFALDGDEFRRRAGRVRGILLDRYRLLAPGRETGQKWWRDNLTGRLIKWLEPRVKLLPSAN